MALSVAVWLVYFAGFKKNPGHPSTFAWMTEPLEFFYVAAAVLGNPIGAAVRPQDPAAAVAVPLLGLLDIGLLTFAVIRTGSRVSLRSNIWAWVALAAFGLTTAIAIAVTRQGFGFVVALSSRYITYIWPLWPATLGLVLFSLSEPLGDAKPDRSPRKERLRRASSRGILALFLIVVLFSTNTLVRRWTPIMHDRARALSELPDLCQGNTALIRSFGLPEHVNRYLDLMTRHRLVKIPPTHVPLDPPTGRPATVGAVDSLRWEDGPAKWTRKMRCVRIAGWAAMESGRVPASKVLLASRSIILKEAWVGKLRSQAGSDYDSDPHPGLGWVIYLNTNRLTPEDRVLDVYAVFPSGTKPVWIGKVSL
jgi:hypothetical protein